MGRNPKSINLHLLEGNANRLTKEEIKKRQEKEESIKGYTDNIQAPSYLLASQKKEFQETAVELIRLDIFSNLDVSSLARYIDSKDQYIKLVKLIRKTKPSEDFKSYALMQRSKNLLYNECRSSASDLGLTITSRVKLVVPQEKEKEESDFEKKFGNI